MDINILKTIERNTNNIYVIVENDTAKKLNGEEIPKEHIVYNKMPKDGIYKLEKNNCGKKECDILSPNPGCVLKKIYSKENCALYSFDELAVTFFTYKEFFNIIKDFSDSQQSEIDQLKADRLEMASELLRINELENTLNKFYDNKYESDKLFILAGRLTKFDN